MPVSVRLHEAEIDRFLGPAGPVYREVERTVARGVALSRTFCPKDEGRLAASIEEQMTVDHVRSRIIGSWGSKLPYAIYVHEGTGIFGPRRTPIRPKKGKFLVFQPSGRFIGPIAKGKKGRGGKGSRGGLVFAREVKGVPPTPYLTQALRIVAPGARIRTGLTDLPF